MLFTTAMSGKYFRNFAVLSKKALSYSSPFDDELAPAAEPIARAVVAEVAGDAAEQHARVGSAAVNTQPVSAVVVVLPCVPAMTIDRAPHRKCSRTASGSDT